MAGWTAAVCAVVDIGSNSVRLAIFDGARRAAPPLYNEKSMCGLGRGLRETGRLDPDGAARALAQIERFAALLRDKGIAQVDAVATAAVRDAEDGAAFAAEIERRSGLRVRVLSGAEEAELAARGVLGGEPGAHGVMGDLGGGSLELVRLDRGAVREHATLPLGALALAAETKGDARRARGPIDEALAGLPWLDAAAGADLYAVGGNWRALARIHMHRADYPLRIIHRYTLPARELARLVSLVATQSAESLERAGGAPRRRAALLPFSALAMERLLRRARPRRVTFSALGLREGLALARLPPETRAEDPLLAACRGIAERAARAPAYGEELAPWTDALFPGETAPRRRLRRAACLVADIGWRAHPEYRAEQAALEILRAPELHASHAERCFLARAACIRYTGAESGALGRAESLLGEGERARARILGLAARFAAALSGGGTGVVGRFPLSLGAAPRALRVEYENGDAAMLGETAMRRFEALAAALGARAETRVRGAP